MSKINYSEYTIDELLDVKQNIDANSPNFVLLEKELNSRKAELEKLEADSDEFDFDETLISTIGGFQIITALVFIYYLYSALNGVSYSLLTVVIYCSFILLNLFAGYTLITRKPKFYIVSMFNPFLHTFSFSLGSVAATYSGFLGVHAVVNLGGVGDSILSFPITPSFSYVSISEQLAIQSIEFNVLAMFFIYKIFTAYSNANKALKQD